MASTRDRLIDAATQLLDEGGPAAVTLREVGRLAGVSHNAPYKHFAGKSELLAAIASRELALPHQPRQAASAVESPGMVVRRMMHAYVSRALRHPARFKLTYGAWESGSDELASAATAARSALVAAVEAAQSSHELPAGDPERTAALLLAVAHGAADLALNGHLSRTGKGHADADDLVDDLFDQLSGMS